MAKLAVFLVLIITFYGQLELNHADSDSIISVAMLTRHGDRTPSGTYPNDPYADYPWPCGLGALTPKGIRQIFKSGMNKAERYKTLLQGLNNNNFEPKQIYVRSSALGRCVESAKSFLDGLVPLLYEHIPIEAPSREEDTMLTFGGKECKNFEAQYQYDLRLDQPAVKAIVGDTKVVEYISNNSGIQVNSLLDIWRPCEVLYINNENGFSLPDWSVPIFHKYVTPLIDLIVERIASTKKMEFQSGILLNDIITRWNPYMARKPGKGIPNILLYSSHGMHLQALLGILGVQGQINSRPTYGSAISLELHNNKKVDSGVEVRVYFFRDENDTKPISLKIPACSTPCAYGKFKKLMAIKLVRESDYDQVCGN